MKERDNLIELPNDVTPLILEGDVFNCLKRIPDKSVNVVVTSPPYWNLRDYCCCWERDKKSIFKTIIGDSQKSKRFCKRI